MSPARTKRSDRRPTARVVHPTFPAATDPSHDALYVNTPGQNLGLALEKIQVLARVISLEFVGGNDAAILADCILDQLTTAKALQQDIEGAENQARGLARREAAIESTGGHE